MWKFVVTTTENQYMLRKLAFSMLRLVMLWPAIMASQTLGKVSHWLAEENRNRLLKGE